MSFKIVHINSLGNVTLSQNPRSRKIRLSVKPNNKILVSFPLIVSFHEAALFAEKHAEWITRQQQKLGTRLPVFPENTEILTRFHQIIIRKEGGKTTLKQTGKRIEISFPESSNMENPALQDHIRKIMTEIYRWEAKKYLPSRVGVLASRFNFRFVKISIRNNKTNWGSCSATNNISLNLKLMKLPDHLVDYIILHELCHTRVKNHSAGFWKLLDHVTGNQARQLSAEIRKYSVL